MRGIHERWPVDVLEEFPAAILFGPYGSAVAEVINLGRSLTEDVASRLESGRHPAAAEAYGRAWGRWRSGKRGRRSSNDPDLSDALQVHGAGRSGSPVGAGLAVVHQAVWDSAKLRGNADVFTVDQEAEEMVLSEPWSTASTALVEAAMAFGAPDLVSGADSAVLTAAWRSAIGTDAVGSER